MHRSLSFPVVGARLAIQFALTFLFTGHSHAQVDFTPVPNSYELDGVKMSNVCFKDGNKQITYNPPADWRISGSGPHLTLLSPSIAKADAQVDVRPTSASLSFDPANLPKYIALAQTFVPKDASKIEILGTEANPLKIGGNDTLAVQVRYAAYGVSYQAYVLFLNRRQDQWTFRCTAPVDTFAKAFEPFRSSLYSITGL